MTKIILDEIGYARKLLEDLAKNPARRLDKKPSRDLSYIARYLGQEEELSQEAVYQRLKELMHNHYPAFNPNAWHGLLDDLSKKCLERRLLTLSYIPVYESELAKIDALKRKPIRRLAFTLLCLARYRLCALPSNNGWINYPYKDIFRLANINATVREQCLMIKELISLDYLHMNQIVDNLSLQILYLDTQNDASPRLKITEFTNLGYEYLLYCGEPYFRCQSCRILSKKTATNNRYCKSCRDSIRKERSRSGMKNLRESRAVNSQYHPQSQ